MCRFSSICNKRFNLLIISECIPSLVCITAVKISGIYAAGAKSMKNAKVSDLTMRARQRAAFVHFLFGHVDLLRIPKVLDDC